MLDGSGGLTERAPLALLGTAAEVHSWCQEALQGQASPMEEHRLIDGGVIEPSLWLEVQKLRPRQAQLVDSDSRSEEHTSELQSRFELVCRLLRENKKNVGPRHRARPQLR